MNIHEYQAKDILTRFNIPIQRGMIISKIDDVIDTANKIKLLTNTKYWIIKAQIHAGGRGKSGGVKLAKSLDETINIAKSLLNKTLITEQTGPEGKIVNKILIAEDLYPVNCYNLLKEYYISIILDRKTESNVMVYSPEGGMSIEEVAIKYPNKIYKEPINPSLGLTDYQARRIAINLNIPKNSIFNAVKIIKCIYKTYISIDANLIEINPWLYNGSDSLYAVDCKISLDDNALYRQLQYALLRDLSEEDNNETEARKNNLNYIKLNGNVGCMVNGAGLAMATMDIIKLLGGNPANFLDIGGVANKSTVEKALNIILRDNNVKIVFINIFGGIVRCDEVAKGIINSYKKHNKIDIPFVIRLNGTNNELAKDIINNSQIKSFHYINELRDLDNIIRNIL